MDARPMNRRDLVLARSLLGQLLIRGKSPTQIRRRVERVLMRADPDSSRYAFWRLILALIIAELPTAMMGRTEGEAA
jgi:hypothetical protein